MCAFHKLCYCLFTTLVFQAASGGEVLLVSLNHSIVLLEVEDGRSASVISADSHVVAFDIHYSWNQLFWATESAIYRTPMYDPQTTTPLAEVGKVGSLAVDWVHHDLYWTDLSYGGGRIEAAHVDGRWRRVVHRLSSQSNMGAMVLDPLLGKLFWLEWEGANDNETRILSCNLDGSAIKMYLKSEFIPNESPLAIDVTLNGIYFYKLTSNASELWSINYQWAFEGTNKLFERAEEHPRSLCLAKDGFYFSNTNGTYSIRWVKNKYTFVYGNRTDHVVSLDPFFRLLDSSLKNASVIRVVSEVVQPQWPDQCTHHRCEHGCVVTGHYSHQHQPNTSCVCRFGYELRADGRTCREKGYLIYSSGETFGRITTKGLDNALLYSDSGANIQTFDVDIDSEYIYWSDLFAQAIYRAPLEQISRKEKVIGDVTAFGLAVDWLHNHVYWTDHTRVMLVASDGGDAVVVLDELDSPGNMAVDPLGRYIFWVECGSYLSIKRAGLNGSDVTVLVADYVTCGMSLTADYVTSTLFILDWAGAVSLVRYDGSGRTRLYSDVVRGLAIVDHQPLWTVIEYPLDPPRDEDAFFRDQLNVLAHDLQPAMIKVVKASHQPSATIVCADVECGGICLPTSQSTTACVCSGGGNKMVPCPKGSKNPKGENPNDYLDIVEITSFSITLQFTGPLMKHKKIRPYVHVQEVASLVARQATVRYSSYVHIDNFSLPFTIDWLNPATSYNLTVQHGVTRVSHTVTLHTPPPPLAVRRLPLATVPGIPGSVRWEKQGVHYAAENPWEQLVDRTYYLLLLSSTEFTQADPPAVPPAVLDALGRRVTSSFMVLDTYTTKEEFDDDPEMFLPNLPWGVTFRLAMVQVTEYKGNFNLDIVHSEDFALPDPYWRPFVDEVLQDHKVIDSIERM